MASGAEPGAGAATETGVAEKGGEPVAAQTDAPVEACRSLGASPRTPEQEAARADAEGEKEILADESETETEAADAISIATSTESGNASENATADDGAAQIATVTATSIAAVAVTESAAVAVAESATAIGATERVGDTTRTTRE